MGCLHLTLFGFDRKFRYTDTGEVYDVYVDHTNGTRYADRRPSPPDLGDGAGAVPADTGDTDDGSQQLKEEA